MKRILAILLGVFLPLILLAEQIDGPANVRNQPNGELLFSLYDSVKVSCAPIEAKWYRVGIVIQISQSQFEDENNFIPMNTEIKDLEGQVIGKTLSDLPIELKMEGGPPDARWYGLEVVGYTYQSNIRPESIPENGLMEVMGKDKKYFTLSDFDDHFKGFDYFKGGILDRYSQDFSEYMIFDSWIDDPSPTDRIRIVFKADRLYAIVHARPLDTKSLDTHGMNEDTWYISFPLELTRAEKNAFKEMNVQAYREID